MNLDARAGLSEGASLAAASTVAATVLCCLPFAAGIFGAGVAALGARVAPWRLYLAAISLGFLAYAFYRAYRRGAVACGPEGCSAQSMRYRRVTVWLVAILVALLLTASSWTSWLIYWTL